MLHRYESSIRLARKRSRATGVQSRVGRGEATDVAWQPRVEDLYVPLGMGMGLCSAATVDTVYALSGCVACTTGTVGTGAASTTVLDGCRVMRVNIRGTEFDLP